MAEVMRYWAGTLHSVHPSQFGMQQYVKDPVVWASDYDALAARLAAVEAECADLIAGKEYQAMQRTLGEVNARLAEVTRERDEAVRELRALRGVIIDAMVNGQQTTDSATPRESGSL